MKRTILTSALGLILTGALAGTAAFAQQAQPTPDNSTGNAAYQHRHHAPNPQRQAEMLSKKLSLSADQTAKLAPIFADRDQKFQSLMQDQSLTPQQRHEQMKAIHQSTEQQLATVLTPDQLQQFKSMRHNHHRNNGPNSPTGDNQAPPPPAPSSL